MNRKNTNLLEKKTNVITEYDNEVSNCAYKSMDEKIEKIEKTKETMRNLLKQKDNPEKYLLSLRKKVIEEMVDIKEPIKTKNQINLAISNKRKLTEIRVLQNDFSIIPQDNEFKFYLGTNKSYFMSDKPIIRIIYKKLYIHIEKNKDLYYVVTNQNIKLNQKINGLSKEKDVISFYIDNLLGFLVEEDTLVINNIQEQKQENAIGDNDTLVISQQEGKVYLPYKAEEIKQKAEKYKDTTPEELIQKQYIVPMTRFTNSIKARYIEAYKLMRYREKKSISTSILLGLEMMFEFHVHPAIIAACKNVEELDIYLDCLDDNELDKFSCFKIVYKAVPKIINRKTQIS